MGLTTKHPPKSGKKPKAERAPKVASPIDLVNGIGVVGHALDAVLEEAVKTSGAIEAAVDLGATAITDVACVRLSAITVAHLTAAREDLLAAMLAATSLSKRIAKRAKKAEGKKSGRTFEAEQ